MRKCVGAVFAAVLLVPLAFFAVPTAAAASAGCAMETGTYTFSPPLPAFGDPTAVVPNESFTATISGCTGLGVTGGTAVFHGVSDAPFNCTINQTGPDPGQTGTLVFTWNTGQTTTADVDGSATSRSVRVVAGLFAGATLGWTVTQMSAPPGSCTSVPLTNLSFVLDPVTLTFPAGTTACGGGRSCDQTQTASATATAPGLTATVTGTSSAGAGAVSLTIATAKLPCPHIAVTSAPVATLSDSGFATTDRLTVTATLPVTSMTNSAAVCFNSTVPFRSQTNPAVPKAGTALLLACTKVANVAPCVISSAQSGDNVVVRFVVPGGDPRFTIVCPTGRQLWELSIGSGKVGAPYHAQFETTGGRTPIHWSLASGTLPKGCTLNPKSGVITGKPANKGHYEPVIRATDSETPPKTASLAVPINIT